MQCPVVARPLALLIHTATHVARSWPLACTALLSPNTLRHTPLSLTVAVFLSAAVTMSTLLFLLSSNATTEHGCLIELAGCGCSIFKKYEFKQAAEREAIQPVIASVFPMLLTMLQQTPSVSTKAATLAHAVTLPHCHTATLSQAGSRCLTLSHAGSRCLTLPHCHTVSRCLTLPHCHTVSRWLTLVTLSHCLTLAHFGHTATLSHAGSRWLTLVTLPHWLTLAHAVSHCLVPSHVSRCHATARWLTATLPHTG